MIMDVYSGYGTLITGVSDNVEVVGSGAGWSRFDEAGAVTGIIVVG